MIFPPLKHALAAVIVASLSFPLRGWSTFKDSSEPGDPPIFTATNESRLAFHPDEDRYADANSLNLEDLGFGKKETEQDAAYQKTLDRRTKMLKIHQLLGLATGVAMAFTLGSATDSVGERGSGGKSARDRHALLGMTTGALYFTTASFSIFAPKVPNQKMTGRTKLHRALAFIHFPAMVATMYYGLTDKRKLDRGQNPSGHKATVANIAALSFYTSLIVMVIPFGGDK